MLGNRGFVLFTLLVLQFVSCKLFALPGEALIVSVQGDVQILYPLSESKAQAANQVLFEGLKYQAAKAKVGLKVHGNDVVMSASGAKAKVIFDRGDVFIVGSGTALIIPSLQKDQPQVSTLLYGKLRAVINHDGPLSGVKFKTRSATVGVRGTDLAISFNAEDAQTEISVLRGEVEVQPEAVVRPVEELAAAASAPATSSAEAAASANSTKSAAPNEADKASLPAPVIVKTGQVAEVVLQPKKNVTEDSLVAKVEDKNPSTPATVPVTVVKDVTAQEVTKIKEDSKIEVASATPISPEIKAEVQVAEKKAVENVIADVTRYDAAAGQELAQKNVTNSEEANQAVAEKAVVSAEVASKTELADADWRWLVGGGFAETWIDGSSLGTSSSNGSTVSNNSPPTPGYLLGGGGQYRFTPRWHLQTGLWLANVNYTNTTTISSWYSAGTSSSSFVMSTYNLMLPVNLHYSVGEHFRVIAGFSMITNLSYYISSGNAPGMMANPNSVSWSTDIGLGYTTSHWQYQLIAQPNTMIFNGNSASRALTLSAVSARAIYLF